MNRARAKGRHEWLDGRAPAGAAPLPNLPLSDAAAGRAGRCLRRPRLTHAGAALVLEERGLAIGAPAIAAGRRRRRGPRDGTARPARPGWRRRRWPPPGPRSAGRSPERPAGRSAPRRRESPAARATPAARTRCPRRRPGGPPSAPDASCRRIAATCARRPASAPASSARGNSAARSASSVAGVVAEHHAADAAIGGGDQQLPERRRRDDGADALAGAAAAVGAGRHAQMAAGLFVDGAAQSVADVVGRGGHGDSFLEARAQPRGPALVGVGLRRGADDPARTRAAGGTG